MEHYSRKFCCCIELRIGMWLVLLLSIIGCFVGMIGSEMYFSLNFLIRVPRVIALSCSGICCDSCDYISTRIVTFIVFIVTTLLLFGMSIWQYVVEQANYA